jgi:hypothetical protein
MPVRDCGEDTCSLKPGLCMEHDVFGWFDTENDDIFDDEDDNGCRQGRNEPRGEAGLGSVDSSSASLSGRSSAGADAVWLSRRHSRAGCVLRGPFAALRVARQRDGVSTVLIVLGVVAWLMLGAITLTKLRTSQPDRLFTNGDVLLIYALGGLVCCMFAAEAFTAWCERPARLGHVLARQATSQTGEAQNARSSVASSPPSSTQRMEQR